VKLTQTLTNVFTSIFSYIFGDVLRHNVTIVVNDSLLNDTFTFKVNSTDTKKPSVDFIGPLFVAEDLAMNFFTTVTDNIGVISCNLSINGILNGTMDISGNIANRSVTLAQPGIYQFLANCSDASGNYNDTSITSITVTDITNPYFNETPTDRTVIYKTPFYYKLNASDNVAIDTFSINDTVNFRISKSGLLENNTELAVGTYSLAISVNDTSNNVNTSLITITVIDITPPVISGVIVNSLTNESGTMNWVTDDPSNSTVRYGTTKSFGFKVSEPSFSTSHGISLTGLKNNTRYYYNITACSSGGCKTNGTFNFTTKQSEFLPIASNVLLKTATGKNLTTENLTLTWTATDANKERVVNITDWRLDGTSIMLLNMPFENNSVSLSNPIDYSTYGNNGNILGGVNWIPNGHYGGAYNFTGIGSDTRVYLSSLQLINNYTISMWIYTIDVGSSGYSALLTDSSGNHGLFFTSSNNLDYYYSGDHATASTITRNRWEHVAVTVHNNIVEFYINGVVDINSYNGVSSFYAEGIGNDNFPDPFIGYIDDVKVFNRVLSNKQILLLNSSRDNIISSQETKLNDTWQSCVTPNDGIEDGLTVCSNNLTIIPPAVIPPPIPPVIPPTPAKEEEKKSTIISTSTCIPKLDCTVWSDCVGGKQTRTCNDLSKCSRSKVETKICNVTAPPTEQVVTEKPAPQSGEVSAVNQAIGFVEKNLAVGALAAIILLIVVSSLVVIERVTSPSFRFKNEFDVKTTRDIVNKAKTAISEDKKIAINIYNNAVRAYQGLGDKKKKIFEKELKEIHGELKSPPKEPSKVINHEAPKTFGKGFDVVTTRDIINKAKSVLGKDKELAVHIYNNAVRAYQGLGDKQKKLFEKELKELKRKLLP
jgi:Concanavalin A-like lectin/glucanases superfamily